MLAPEISAQTVQTLVKVDLFVGEISLINLVRAAPPKAFVREVANDVNPGALGMQIERILLREGGGNKQMLGHDHDDEQHAVTYYELASNLPGRGAQLNNIIGVFDYESRQFAGVASPIRLQNLDISERILFSV